MTLKNNSFIPQRTSQKVNWENLIETEWLKMPNSNRYFSIPRPDSPPKAFSLSNFLYGAIFESSVAPALQLWVVIFIACVTLQAAALIVEFICPASKSSDKLGTAAQAQTATLSKEVALERLRNHVKENYTLEQIKELKLDALLGITEACYHGSLYWVVD